MTRVLEVNECGELVISAEIVGAEPHTSYSVEVDGDRLLVQPNSARRRATAEEIEAWRHRWHALAKRIGGAWSSDKSAAEIVSEMRR